MKILHKKFLHICPLFLILAVFCFSPLAVSAASYQWSSIDSDGHLQLINTDTKKPVKSRFLTYKGYTYYFDKNGYVSTGWTKVKNDWYYFNASGAMVTESWVSGVQGKYYLLKNGKMAKKRWVTDSEGIKSYVGADGRQIPNYNKKVKSGMKKTAKGTRFLQADGSYAASQWLCYKGSWYYFYRNGYMAKSSFIGKRYVGRTGKMIVNRTMTIGKYRYTFDKDGEIIKKVRKSTKK